MKNAIELAKYTKKIYQATNGLLEIVVKAKKRTKKMKSYDEIRKDFIGNKLQDQLNTATSHILSAVLDFQNWISPDGLNDNDKG